MFEQVVHLLIEVAVKSLVLVVLVAVALLAARKNSAAQRHMVLLLATIALLALPVATSLLPSWDVAVPGLAKQTPSLPPAASTANVRVLLPENVPGPVVSPVRAPNPMPQTTGQQRSASQPVDSWAAAAEYLPLFWLVGFLVVSTRAVLSLRVARSLVTNVRRPSDQALRHQLAELSADACLWAKPRIAVSNRSDVVPMAFGVIRPIVVVPSTFEQWPADRQSATLRHELGHIRRWDWLWLMFSNAACCLYWFNPLVWRMARQMRHEAELACDDLVLQQGLGPTHYATQILEVVRTMNRTKSGMKAVVQMAGESQFEARVKALLTPGRSRAGVASWSLLALASLVGAVAAPIAAIKLQDEPKSDVQKDAQAKKVEKAEKVVVLQKKGEPTVVVKVVQDGKAKAGDQKAAELTKKHLAEAKKQVQKELDQVKSRIRNLKSSEKKESEAQTELKAMQMAEKALERAMSQLDSASSGVRVFDSEGAFVWTPKDGKDLPEAAGKARELWLKSLPGANARAFVWRGFDEKSLPDALKRFKDKDGNFRYEFRNYDDKELSKRLQRLEDLDIQIPDVLSHTESALKESLKQLEKSQKDGAMSKEELEAARKGIEKALQSLEKRRKESKGKVGSSLVLPDGKTLEWRLGSPNSDLLFLEAPGRLRVLEGLKNQEMLKAVPRLKAPQAGSGSSSIDKMIERSEKRMEEREKRLGEGVSIEV